MVEKYRNKGTKKCVIKTKLRHRNDKSCVLHNEIILKPQQGFKNEAHNVYTKEINNIVLSSNDNKRLQTYDRITAYPYGTRAVKVFKTEMLSIVNIND